MKGKEYHKREKDVDSYNKMKLSEPLKPITVGKIKEYTDEDYEAIRLIDEFIEECKKNNSK